jgi:hypothetical protein
VLWFEAAPYKPVLQRNGTGRPRQPGQGTCPYPEILSKLLIKVHVVIFGEVMKPTLKQADDSVGRMSGNNYSTRCRAALGRRFSESLGRLLTLYHGQFNSLSVFKSHFGERLKHSVFVEGFDAFCHG